LLEMWFELERILPVTIQMRWVGKCRHELGGKE
jgi:hypothetical protein